MMAKQKPLLRNELHLAAKEIIDHLLQKDFSTYFVERQAKKIIRICKKSRYEAWVKDSGLAGLSLEELKARFIIEVAGVR